MIAKKIAKYLFRKIGYEIKNINIPLNFWNINIDFVELYKKIENNTLVSADRCFMVYQYANYAKSIEGEIAQVGVYKGGSAKLIAEVFKNVNKKIYLFDTFAGMPKTDYDLDLHKQGDFSDINLGEVKEYLKDYFNLEFHKGLFPETAKGLEDKKFCFVYLDVDIYQSIKDGLEFFYNKMSSGGIIVIDDYEGKNCPGVKKAIDEFIEKKNIYPIVTAKAQCTLIKK